MVARRRAYFGKSAPSRWRNEAALARLGSPGPSSRRRGAGPEPFFSPEEWEEWLMVTRPSRAAKPSASRPSQASRLRPSECAATARAARAPSRGPRAPRAEVGRSQVRRKQASDLGRLAFGTPALAGNPASRPSPASQLRPSECAAPARAARAPSRGPRALRAAGRARSEPRSADRKFAGNKRATSVGSRLERPHWPATPGRVGTSSRAGDIRSRWASR